ncbi:MAG: phosphatase PAP2 family protein [Solirubrobacteraceae bacterium]
MRHRLHSIEGRVLPRGWSDVIRQMLLGTGAYVLYTLVRSIVHGGAFDPGYKPFGDATRIIHLERVLHVFAEPSIQAWVAGRHWLMDFADWTYLNAHYVVTLGAIVFIYLRRNDSFYFVRNMFMIAMAIALVGYALYPTAPPRLMPEWGFTDSIKQFTGVQLESDGPASAMLNLYAAVPSIHVCFALMVGFPMARLVRHRPARLAWRLYPLLIAFVVVATGNHYLTDVLLGALTAGGAALLAERLLARARPDVWAFGHAPASGECPLHDETGVGHAVTA